LRNGSKAFLLFRKKGPEQNQERRNKGAQRKRNKEAQRKRNKKAQRKRKK
jgi:hypothetical protein